MFRRRSRRRLSSRRPALPPTISSGGSASENPRLAVSGLNPHAGEGGSMGSEDEAVIRPAIDALRAEGIDAFGPLPADTMFHARARAGYDAAICMYHDQALIPAKTLAFDETVNVTLGLPFIRTSPDHGTAFDIAGKGIARPDSLIAALRLAGFLPTTKPPSDEPRRPAAAARSHRAPRASGEEIARPEFPARPQSDRQDRADRRRPVANHGHRGRPRPRRADPRAADARRQTRRRHRARRALPRSTCRDRRPLSRQARNDSPATR